MIIVSMATLWPLGCSCTSHCMRTILTRTKLLTECSPQDDVEIDAYNKSGRHLGSLKLIYMLQVVFLDCILRHHTGNVSTAVARTLVQICIPFAVLAGICVFWVVYYFVAKKGSPRQARRDFEWLHIRLRLSCYSVLGYFHPSITAAALNVFSCYRVDHPIPSGTPYPNLLQVSMFACFRAWIFLHHLQGAPLSVGPGIV